MFRRVLILTAITAAAAAAQPGEPPPLVQIVRRPGINAVPLRDYASVRAAVDVLGITAMTGVPETWQVEMHDAFASIEALDRAFTSAGIAQPRPLEPSLPPRTMIGIYQPGWSYRPREAVTLLPKARFVLVSIYHMRPGGDKGLGELMRLRREKMNSVNLDRPDLIYRIVSGAESATYVVLAPMVSLKILDDSVAALPTYAEPIAAAEAEAGQQQAAVDLNRENLLFRVDPVLSYVSNDFAAADQEFWRGKSRGQ